MTEAPQGPEPRLRVAGPHDAGTMLRIITAAFTARPVLDPPADALGDELADIEARLRDHVGIIASEAAGDDVGCLFLSTDATTSPPTATLHRVSVLPAVRRSGIALSMVRAAVDLALDAGMRRLQLVARRELPNVISWWGSNGFGVDAELDAHRFLLGRALPVRLNAPTADDMTALGRRLADLLTAGDLVVLNGELGAGKTTLAQGIGAGLQVAGPITSPTFVLSRIHRSTTARPQLVHVDAYRLGSAAELDDLDLDASLADSVTLVEWGAGVADGLATDRLEIDIERSPEIDDETRVVTITGLGSRWRDVDLWALAAVLHNANREA